METSSTFKLRVKYGGYFKSIKNTNRLNYQYGRQKTLFVNVSHYNIVELWDEVNELFPWNSNQNLLLYYLDKNATQQSFVPLATETHFESMIQMHDEKKTVVIYVTNEELLVLLTSASDNTRKETEKDDGDERITDEESDYCGSESSYHSMHSSDEEDQQEDEHFLLESEAYQHDKNNPKIEVHSKFPDASSFRRALAHYAVKNGFEYRVQKSDKKRVTAICAMKDCSWRIHASILQDNITFEVKTLQPKHTCSNVNKCGNKLATQYWICDRVVDWLRKEGDLSASVLRNKLRDQFGLEVPYLRVFRGKELAMSEIHGKWEESYTRMYDFKAELLRKNPGSKVAIKTVEQNNKHHFQRMFIALGTCTTGFLQGCRPYLGLDGCHLKGKFKGILASATAIDGNSGMFPVAYGILESENIESWKWFLEALKEAIGTPEGLVLSSDMQKGLIEAVATVYPLVEHRECMRHLYCNFKKKFHGDFFKFALWNAARTYSPKQHGDIINQIKSASPDAAAYLVREHSKLWSRSQFGTLAKCDYLTNNFAETFNSWISETRNRPVLDLLDNIRQKIMLKFEQRRHASRRWRGQLVPIVARYIRNLSMDVGPYIVHRSTETSAEVEGLGHRCEVLLDKKTCSCRVWQVKGLPCIHAIAFICSLRGAKWEDYVDSYFTVEMHKIAYAIEIPPMVGKEEWLRDQSEVKLWPPILRRPLGRPCKNRIKAHDEPKRRHKCKRCGMFGHRASKCKNDVSNFTMHNYEGTSQQGLYVSGSMEKTTKRSKKSYPSKQYFNSMQT